MDIDVPLFIPLYGQRRLTDLRNTAHLEIKQGHRINGQMNFESGWEFGYHISNMVTARAVWNPQLAVRDDWEAFRQALRPLTSIFGKYGSDVTDSIIELSMNQVRLLIEGRVNGAASPDLTKLSGHAYVSGTDTWVDIPRMLGISFTQPDKVHLTESDDPQWADALAIMREMSEIFQRSSDRFNAIVESASNDLDKIALNYLQEIADSTALLALRVRYNYVLYQSQDSASSAEKRSALLLEGRSLLHQAGDVIDNRVSQFRVPSKRIAGWRQNPTVYPYGYVWAASSLYYWWRDQGIAEGRSEMSVSPCYLNRMEPLELGFGKGKVLEQALRILLKSKGMKDDDATVAVMLADCLAPPLKEIKFPRDL